MSLNHGIQLEAYDRDKIDILKEYFCMIPQCFEIFGLNVNLNLC